MIIDFTEYKYGTKLNMTLSDDKSDVKVAAIVEEISWAPNRTPFLVHLMIDDSEEPQPPYKLSISEYDEIAQRLEISLK